MAGACVCVCVCACVHAQGGCNNLGKASIFVRMPVQVTSHKETPPACLNKFSSEIASSSLSRTRLAGTL